MQNPPARTAVRLTLLAAGTALACAAALAATSAQATTVTDGSGILDTFSTKPGVKGDPNNPGSKDLNAISATAKFDAQNVYLSATMEGDIGLTRAASIAAGETGEDIDQGVYVWGVNRGAGTAILNTPGNALGTDASTPIGGPDIKFDAFIVMTDLVNGHGDGFVALVGDDGKVAGTPFALGASNISFSGATINLVVPLTDLPTNGFDVAGFGYNIWPRYNSLGANNFVASFLPGDHNFEASAAVPEPASWALMITGFGLAGGLLRRRRARTLPQGQIQLA